MYAVKPSFRSLVDFNLRPAVTINDWVNCYYGFYQIFSVIAIKRQEPF